MYTCKTKALSIVMYTCKANASFMFLGGVGWEGERIEVGGLGEGLSHPQMASNAVYLLDFILLPPMMVLLGILYF